MIYCCGEFSPVSEPVQLNNELCFNLDACSFRCLKRAQGPLINAVNVMEQVPSLPTQCDANL